jgi:cell division septation protein DedD
VRRLAGGLLIALLAGCAPLPTPTSSQPPPVSRPAPASPTAPRASTTPAVIDSTPSSEAREVLNSIPEPIAAADRVPAPTGPTTASPGTTVSGTPSGSSGAPAQDTQPGISPPVTATPDSGASAADTVQADVPVPEKTQPLGERPGGNVPAITDSMMRPRTPPPAPEAVAKSDTCWRVQIAARKDKTTAENLRNAAHSQLMLNFVVDREGGMYKVRSRDCMVRSQADAVRTRAVQSGFKGTFLSPVAPKK